MISGKQKQCENEQRKSEMNTKIQTQKEVVVVGSSHQVILVAEENRKVERFPLVLDLKDEVSIRARRYIYRNHIVSVQHLLVALLEIVAHFSNHFYRVCFISRCLIHEHMVQIGVGQREVKLEWFIGYIFQMKNQPMLLLGVTNGDFIPLVVLQLGACCLSNVDEFVERHAIAAVTHISGVFAQLAFCEIFMDVECIRISRKRQTLPQKNLQQGY